MRTIGVVTVARSDYGHYRPVLKQIQSTPDLQLHLYVTGMHLSPEFGMTVRELEDDGFVAGDTIEMLLSSDTPQGIAKSVGLGVIGFAQVFARSRPDILMVLGDRFEMLSAVTAALPFRIPIAHIHGGELTEGAIDEAIRHAITKMSHIHFATTAEYAQRIVQMGEEPWRVMNSGAPGLDNLTAIQYLSPQQLSDRFGLHISGPFLLVTFHPVTLEFQKTQQYIRELLAALERVPFDVIFTYPNADTNGRLIIEAINAFVTRRPNAQAVVNLGTQGYFSLMREAVAMVGNSSSGMIEAASFRLPVVNIGKRQQGRVHGCNVIHVENTEDDILLGIHKATSQEFGDTLSKLENCYGDGKAAVRITDRLRTIEINEHLLLKRFYTSGHMPDTEHQTSFRRPE